MMNFVWGDYYSGAKEEEEGPASSSKEVKLSLRDFHIVDELFRSAHGVVYTARRRRGANKRELVVLKERRCAELGKRRDISNEAMLLKQLSHPHVIACYGSFWDDSRRALFVVLEHAAGGDLHKLIERRKRRKKVIPEEWILKAARQLCRGVRHLHEHGVVHRDVKALNVLVGASPKDPLFEEQEDLPFDPKLKIADLGVSRQVSEQTVFLQTMYGTPLYTSPEVCEGRPYNEKVDIWSLGVVIYELAALRHPFMAKSLVALALCIKRGEYDPLSKEYSAKISGVVSQMLQLDMQKRPSVAQVIDLLGAEVEEHVEEQRRRPIHTPPQQQEPEEKKVVVVVEEEAPLGLAPRARRRLEAQLKRTRLQLANIRKARELRGETSQEDCDDVVERVERELSAIFAALNDTVMPQMMSSPPPPRADVAVQPPPTPPPVVVPPSPREEVDPFKRKQNAAVEVVARRLEELKFREPAPGMQALFGGEAHKIPPRDRRQHREKLFVGAAHGQPQPAIPIVRQQQQQQQQQQPPPPTAYAVFHQRRPQTAGAEPSSSRRRRHREEQRADVVPPAAAAGTTPRRRQREEPRRRQQEEEGLPRPAPRERVESRLRPPPPVVTSDTEDEEDVKQHEQQGRQLQQQQQQQQQQEQHEKQEKKKEQKQQQLQQQHQDQEQQEQQQQQKQQEQQGQAAAALQQQQLQQPAAGVAVNKGRSSHRCREDLEVEKTPKPAASTVVRPATARARLQPRTLNVLGGDVVREEEEAARRRKSDSGMSPKWQINAAPAWRAKPAERTASSDARLARLRLRGAARRAANERREPDQAAAAA